jgi:hypothetical protein
MRRGVRLALAVLVACLVVGAAGYGTLRVFASGPPGCQRSGLASETKQLLAQNGLYYVPQLRGPRAASLYDSAYGLLTLQALGARPQVKVSAADAVQLRQADATASPIWSRWYVLAIQRVSGQTLLGADDASAVAQLLSPAGYFDDRPAGAPTPSAAEEVATTAAALDILAAIDGEAYTRSLAPTAQWIAGITAQFADNPYVLSLAVTVMGHLGLAVPPQVVSDVVDWYGKLRTSNATVDYSSVSHGLYGYTRILGMVGRTPEPDAAFLAPFFRSAADQNDLQEGYYAAASWSALSGDRTVIAPLEQRLRGNLTPNGLVQEQGVFVGGIDATYEMTRILEANGELGCSALASGALASAKAQNWASWDPISKGMWLATVQMTGGKADSATRWATYDALTQTMPGVLTPENAKQWAMTTELLGVTGGHVPRPTVRPWPVDDRIGVMAAAMTVNAMHELGQPAPELSWIKREDLAAALTRLDLTPTLQEYLDALRAFVFLGGNVSGAMLSQARSRLGAVRGCPGLPDLMRSTPGEQTCDLVATRSAIEAASVVRNLNPAN